MDNISVDSGIRNPFALSEEEKKIAHAETFIPDEEVDFSYKASYRHPVSAHVIKIADHSDLISHPSTHRTSTLSLGMLNAFTGFYNLYFWSQRAVHSIKHYDFESKIEALLRVFSAPLAISNAVESIVIFAATFFKGLAVVAISLSAMILGTLFLTVEAGLEVYRILKMVKFSNNLNYKHVEKQLKVLVYDGQGSKEKRIKILQSYVKRNKQTLITGTSPKVIENLEKAIEELVNKKPCSENKVQDALRAVRICLMQKRIQLIHDQYLTLSKSEIKSVEEHAEKLSLKDKIHSKEELVEIIEKRCLKGKSQQLARRIGVSIIEKLKIHEQIFRHTFSTKNKTEFQDLEFKTEKLFTKLQEKNNKTLKVHAVGLAAIALGFVMIALSYATAPVGAIIAFGAIATILQTGRFLAPRSYIDHDEKHFTLKPWIEDIKNFFGFGKKKTIEFISMETFKTNVNEEEVKSSIDINQTDCL